MREKDAPSEGGLRARRGFSPIEETEIRLQDGRRKVELLFL